MAEFYSATVRLFDRFCGPVLLRDSQITLDQRLNGRRPQCYIRLDQAETLHNNLGNYILE